MQWTPNDYMIRAVKMLVGQGSVGLFLDPGMGKTAICLAAFTTLKELGYVDKMLVIAPIRPMYGTWPAEIAKWADFNHLTYAILHGKNKKAYKEDVDIYICNPDTAALHWLFGRAKYEKTNRKTKEVEKIPATDGVIKSMPAIDVLCIDESTKFKNSTTGRFKSMCRHYGVHNFNRRWCLTGTPTPNGLEDLFGQVYILDQGAALGRFVSHYRDDYFVPDPRGYGWSPMVNSFANVTEKISPLVLQLSAKEHLQLPELMKITIPIELPPVAAVQYKEMEKEFLLSLEKTDIIAKNVASAGVKCRQICNGAIYDAERNVLEIHDQKLGALEDLFEELNGHPILIVYEFKHDKQRIEKRFGEMPCITGATGQRLEWILEQFNAGGIPYLLAHAGSTHGLNIQESCNHLIFFCTTWNLEYYIQTIDRLVRQGNAAAIVMCYFLVATGTIDERVAKAVEEKGETQSLFRSLLDEHRAENLKDPLVGDVGL